MQSIQNLASEAQKQLFSNHWHYVENRLSRDKCSDALWELVGFLSDKYLSEFLDTELETISDINSAIESPEDLLSSHAEWTSPELTDWLASDRQHYEIVEDIVKQCLKPEEISNFDLCSFIQLAVWKEMDMVYHAVVVYLFEAYEAQEDIDEDEDSDIE